MTEAHDELRKRLTAYRDAKALYESPDPYDREEARYEAMHVAGGRIGHDEALALALLDEHGALLDENAVLRMAAGMHEHFVCPGCHAVDEEACLPGCIDAEIEGERRTPFDGFSEFMADDGDEPEEGGTR